MFHHWPIFSSQASQQPETDLGFPCLSNKPWSEAFTAQVIGSENLSGTQAKAAASRPYAPAEQLPLRWMRLLDSSPGLLELLENQPTSGLQLSLHIKPDTRMCLNIRKCHTSPLTKVSSISDVQCSIWRAWRIKRDVGQWHELVS